MFLSPLIILPSSAPAATATAAVEVGAVPSASSTRLLQASFRAGVPVSSASSCGFPPSKVTGFTHPFLPQPLSREGQGLAWSPWGGARCGNYTGPSPDLPSCQVTVHQAESFSEKGWRRDKCRIHSEPTVLRFGGFLASGGAAPHSNIE